MPEDKPTDVHRQTRFPGTRNALRTAVQRAAHDLIKARRGRVPAPYLPLLGSPRVADLFEQLSTELWTGTLPRSVLEAIFLMTAHRQKCRHQWQTHADKALAAGVTASMIDTIASGGIPTDGGALEIAGRFYASLADAQHVSDDALLDAMHQFGEQGTAELVAFCGMANMVAMLLNVQSTLEPCPIQAC
ncbi:carboxymuconolactone decarboxylase family protein [Variovorax arabinosiphilus]|uniref:carboxymuconolactone decarboxylase family protein n=1 Tax=Variovorax arabinosiphilus TaxID=3053498 RepID=UPI0025775CB0|nr:MULTISPECIES: carboxymuconolactone decarboxylase family protein [unclassified Variovorax]MDM0118337.1 carboxymuconolactone decarboxylase family protein [Variovorax sp. J2L1-78]MDM0128762.1 carboxymuconolactone decarboxylase family protein [Variovorax sp. J2L1-63]MDM0233452.1 carboxymuconolactone decarboxylase family protein [Variovorax sp. J2R1-6]